MLPRFQHILVPVDFTAKNRQALDIAFEIAEVNRAAVTLLHVIEQIEGATDTEIDEFYRQLQTRADGNLETMAQRFSAAGLPVEYKIRRGKRLQEVLQYIQERSIDLVVLSSHPVDTERPFQSMSTLSYQISLACPCPVLMVK